MESIRLVQKRELYSEMAASIYNMVKKYFYFDSIGTLTDIVITCRETNRSIGSIGISLSFVENEGYIYCCRSCNTFELIFGGSGHLR